MGEKKIRPLGDRVIVERAKEEERIGSIYVPDAAKEKPVEGTVIAVGPGRILDNGMRIEPSVKKGDRVIFGRYSGQEDRGKSDRLFLREDDIIGVIED